MLQNLDDYTEAHIKQGKLLNTFWVLLQGLSARLTRLTNSGIKSLIIFMGFVSSKIFSKKILTRAYFIHTVLFSTNTDLGPLSILTYFQTWQTAISLTMSCHINSLVKTIRIVRENEIVFWELSIMGYYDGRKILTTIFRKSYYCPD